MRRYLPILRMLTAWSLKTLLRWLVKEMKKRRRYDLVSALSSDTVFRSRASYLDAFR